MILAFLLAAGLLSLERLFYLWVWNHAERFTRWVARCDLDPVTALQIAFTFFKGVQIVTFTAWCIAWGGLVWSWSGRSIAAAAAGIALIAIGQFLNYSVFHRLGRVGVFYGNRFGRPTRWCSEF